VLETPRGLELRVAVPDRAPVEFRRRPRAGPFGNVTEEGGGWGNSPSMQMRRSLPLVDTGIHLGGIQPLLGTVESDF